MFSRLAPPRKQKGTFPPKATPKKTTNSKPPKSHQRHPKKYAALNWTGSFEDYLNLVRKNPAVTRSAFQRVYDMILSYGQEEYIDNKKKLIRYNFFKDEQHGGRDAIFGLDIPLMRLVSVLQSAAQRYGTERRVILLHGPVGSSKSTIARLIKRGIEEYSRTPEGALYTYDWVLPEKRCTTSRAARRPSSARCTRSRCA